MSTTTSKAYSYIRFSTPEQASGDSYRRQAELSNRYAEEHGLNLDTSLSLCDLGISGLTGENRSKGALALFLKAVETGKVPAGSFLVVESLDRLSRDTMSEQMSLFIGLINAGLTVVTLADGQSYSKTTINNDRDELAGLVKIARTSDRPPKALLVEMGELEKQQLAAQECRACLEKRMDGIRAQVGSIEEEQGLIAKLAQATDERSRLRLRQLIRKRVARIDLFPRGSCGRTHADAPAQARRKPCFRIRFVDDLVSWVCCSIRNPSKNRASADYSSGK